MITLISLIIVCVGIFNWFTIGAFQYDFIAGLFGSQANIFSRFIYVLVGICGIFLAYSIIRNKGKIIMKNKTDKELFNFKKHAKVSLEASNDNHIDENNYENKDLKKSYDDRINEEIANHKIEVGVDNSNLHNKDRFNDNHKLGEKNFNNYQNINHKNNNYEK